MAFEATGTLYKISDVQQITDSFRKREFVLEMIDGAYTQLIPFQLTQDNCVKVDDMLPGTEIKVTFNLRGREWTSPQGEAKYFGSLDAWKVDRVAHETPAPAATPQREAAPTASNDDLPF
mgnify:FL=1